MPCGVPWPASAAISTARAMVPPDGRPCGVGGCMSKRFWKASISRLPSLLRDLCIIVSAALRVTGCDCSNGQGLVFTIEPCLTKIKRHTDGCSCAIHRTGGWGTTHNRVGLRYSELYLGHNKACV